MRKIIFLLLPVILLSACTNVVKTPLSTNEAAPTQPSSSAVTNAEPVLDGDVYNLLVTENNFGTNEIIANQDEPLILSIRNQLQDPINVVIDELGVKSKDISFGEVVEITIPTDEPGEYEMYSSLGSQRKDGFSALIIIDEKVPSEDEL
jgi:hypothetical protein